MQVNESNNPSFKSVRYISPVKDLGENAMVRFFEKNKDFDLYLRKNGNKMEWKVERPDFVKANPRITLCDRIKLVPETLQKYFEKFVNKKGEF